MPAPALDVYKRQGEDYITMPYLANDELIERVCKDAVSYTHLKGNMDVSEMTIALAELLRATIKRCV